jgi:hypothetical protein
MLRKGETRAEFMRRAIEAALKHTPPNLAGGLSPPGGVGLVAWCQ